VVEGWEYMQCKTSGLASKRASEQASKRASRQREQREKRKINHEAKRADEQKCRAVARSHEGMKEREAHGAT
jgi:hypothetical protein